ncbi:MAG: MoxR family ATPase [Clostridia bacterium]|nr:MoxR family ATPase [Anaerotignum sp.]NCC15235.1 MoxR family ATPase [Clostridia bacterium]
MEEEMIRQFGTELQKIEAAIGKVMIGQKDLIRGVLTAMIAGGNVLLEGLPGLGKTQLIKTIGKVLDLDFSRIQFTPDLMPADVTGTSVMTKKLNGEMGMEFRRGPIFSNIVLADEINRATPKTQSALLEAMQEHTVTSGNETYSLAEPFFVLATQNPLESEGTYPLPEAQMDRFLFKLEVAFPSKAELLEIVSSTTTGSQREAQMVCSKEKLMEMRGIAREVPVAAPVAEYIMEVVLKSHPDYAQAPEMVKKYVRFGASPRGAQAIMMTARVYALMAGRYNVAYEDVKAVAKGALRHRIFLNFEGMADGVTVDQIIEALLV